MNNKTTIYEAWLEHYAEPSTTEEILITGLCSEAGEVAAEWLKTARKQVEPTEKDLDARKDELGDVLYYVARLAKLYGSSLEEVMRINLIKLEKRELNGKQ